MFNESFCIVFRISNLARLSLAVCLQFIVWRPIFGAMPVTWTVAQDKKVFSYMADANEKKVNALGEPMWVDVLKGVRVFVVFMLITAAVGGGLAIAIIAPWGRANPECSIFCVLANKLKDPIEWSAFEKDSNTRDMALAVQAEMKRNGFSYDMPNYKQHKVHLNNKQYMGMLKEINNSMIERKNNKTGIPMNIIEDLYSIITSEKYMNIDANHAKFEKTYLFKRVFEKRKDIALANLYDIRKPEFEEKAKQGDANAQFNLGLLYLTGKDVAKDPVEAELWLTRAASQGHARAQFTLARMFHQGKGVPQNYEAAVKWYTKAAEYGHTHAQHHLGMMYNRGLGVEKNEQTAKKWWGRAAQVHRANENESGEEKAK